MVDHGQQVGGQGAGGRDIRLFAGQHVQEIAGMAQVRALLHQGQALQQPVVDSHDDRETGDDGLRAAQLSVGGLRGGLRIVQGQGGHGHAQGVDDRRLDRGRAAQQFHGGHRQRAGRDHPLFLGGQLGGVGQAVMPEQEDALLEAGVRGQRFQRHSADDEDAVLAVDVTQAGARRDDAFQSGNVCRHGSTILQGAACWGGTNDAPAGDLPGRARRF